MTESAKERSVKIGGANERERGHPPHPPPLPPQRTPFHQSIWPCQNIKCMLLLLSKRCLRFLKALIQAWVDGNQGIFSCAKRGNNTQLITAQQRGLGCVCKECTGQITTLHSAGRGHKKGAGQGFELLLLKLVLRFVYGEKEDESMALDFYWSICQKHFTH